MFKIRNKFGLVIFMVFVVYLIIVFYIVFLKNRFVSQNINYEIPLKVYWQFSVNLTPFKTIKNYIIYDNNLSDSIKYINVLGNVVLFIPFGFMYPILIDKNRKFLWIFLCSFIFSLSIELLQMMFRIGSLDVDDIILNVFGAIIGYCVFRGVYIIRRMIK